MLQGEQMSFDPVLKVWSLHPNACRIEKADVNLNGYANQDAIKFCGPYKFANQTGYWVYSPVDIDILWKGGREFEYVLHTPYDNSDYKNVQELIRDDDPISNNNVWISPCEGRTKFTFGLVEEGLVQIWTGCIFKTPSDWCLQIRSPINFPKRGFHIMNGVLDTDWMFYDIWINITFTVKNEWIKIRKNDGVPLAQLVPIPRKTYAEEWKLSYQSVNRDDEESNSVFKYWLRYNQKKFNCGGKQLLSTDGSYRKNSGTFFSERQISLCPHLRKNNRKVCYMVNNDQKYFYMLYTSIKMLRDYNREIPIEIILLSDFIPDELKNIQEKFNVNFLLRENKNNEYFFYNREYISEIECDSLLYLDSDTFVNFDVNYLFDKYHHDFVGSDNFWVYSHGWDNTFLPRIKSPYNGGVILTNKFRHKELFKEYIPIIEEIEKNIKKEPIYDWCINTNNGYNKEEIALSIFVDKSDWVNGYFETKDVYNIRTIEDLDKIQDHGIFHVYGHMWESAIRRIKSKLKNRFISNQRFVK